LSEIEQFGSSGQTNWSGKNRFLAHVRRPGRRRNDIWKESYVGHEEYSKGCESLFCCLTDFKLVGIGSYKKPFEKYSRLKPNRDGHSSYTLGGTVQTNPPILSPVAHSAERSQYKDDDLIESIKSYNRRAAMLGAHVVAMLFPPVTSGLQKNRHTMLDPPNFGAEENYSFSGLQINISPLTETDLSSLGYSGTIHIDRHDDPMSITLLICMSYLEPSTDPGKFYNGETREWCTLYPFSIVLFRGNGPHGGTQAIASGEPLHTEKRINLILYPRKEFLNRTLPIRYPCYTSQQLADYSFFTDGGACFGTDEYHKSWCLMEYM